MDTEQLNKFCETAILDMESKSLFITQFSNNPIIDSNGDEVYDFGYSIWQNTPTERAGNYIAQIDLIEILNNYRAFKEEQFKNEHKGWTEDDILKIQINDSRGE